ncbi:MAG: hypothetical protein PW791_12315 [Neorhizobium sp.]|nr:hypothetical protein [Neorhizobium sp.]
MSTLTPIESGREGRLPGCGRASIAANAVFGRAFAELHPLDPRGVYLGNPARKIKERKLGAF